jgi:hypothetical protein
MDGRFQPVESGFSGSEGNLLFENDVDERGEAGLADPQTRLAVFFHDFSQMGIAICERTHAFIEGLFIQDGLRGWQGEVPLESA